MRVRPLALFPVLAVTCLLWTPSSSLTYPYGDRWYQNPLGFEPVALHTRNGFLLPALGALLALTLTDPDASTGAWRWRAGGGVAEGYKHPATTMSQLSLGAEWRARRYMALGADVELHLPYDDYNATAGLALRPFARVIPARGERWEAWFEAGGGLVRYFDEFPQPTALDSRRGTFLNGTTQYGVGAEWRLTDATAFQVAARHVHVSNGNTIGAARNPSHDSNGLFVGISRRLR